MNSKNEIQEFHFQVFVGCRKPCGKGNEWLSQNNREGV